jgi:hypothetical protein
MAKDPEPTLHAEVVLRGAVRQSFSLSAEDTIPATSTDPGISLQDRLRQFGFQIVAASPTSISIAGRRELFSRIFGLEDAEGSLPVPEEIVEQVEGIYLQPIPDYFGRA